MRRFRVTATPMNTTLTCKEDTPYAAYCAMVGTLQGYAALSEINYSAPCLWRGTAINNETQMGATIWVKELT